MTDLHEEHVLIQSHKLARQTMRARSLAAPAGMFGTRYETRGSFAAGLWEMHGDGRLLVTPIERSVLMQGVAYQMGGACLEPGFARLATRIVRDASGVPAFEQAVRTGGESVAGASPRECLALQLIGRYRELIKSLGLVEEGEALGLLAQDGQRVMPASARVIALAPELLTPQIAALCAAAGVQTLVEPDPLSLQVQPLASGVDLSFAFPQGGYATGALVEQILQDAPGRVLVACSKPLQLAQALAAPLAAAGKTVALSGSIGFSDTAVGRVLVALHFTLAGEEARDTSIASPLFKSALADAVLSPLSCCEVRAAREVDVALRANRILTRAEAIQTARAAGEGATVLIDAARDFNAADLDAIEEQVKTAFGFDRSRLAVEYAAVQALREGAAVAKGGGVDANAVLASLQLMNVTVNAASAPTEQPDVLVTTLGSAAVLEPGSFDTLVALDLTSAAHPVSSDDDAKVTLLSKMGIDLRRDPLAQARWEFNRALLTARCRVVLSRPLNDDKAEPTYPCVALQEFVDCYRDDPSDTQDIDNPYMLPASLQGGLLERGEEALFANAVASDGAVQAGRSVAVLRGDLLVGGAPDPACPPVVQMLDGVPVLAPSVVERYLECPRKWLVESRLKASGLDEGFTPLEKGLYRHEVLSRFYDAFNKAGRVKVAPHNRDVAREVMRQVVEEARASQPQREPLSGRLVPANRIEEHDVALIGRELERWLDFEEQLLPAFTPRLREHAFEGSERISYGGCYLKGRADRIDVDDQGNAVVIDYKGSLGPEYNPRQHGEPAPGKVQALMYASAIARQEGLHPVGALYVSYRKQDIAGAWSTELDGGQLPAGNPDNSLFAASGPDSFEELLDQTEQRVAWAVDRMMNGFCAPEPCAPYACRYCPAVNCEGRCS